MLGSSAFLPRKRTRSCSSSSVVDAAPIAASASSLICSIRSAIALSRDIKGIPARLRLRGTLSHRYPLQRDGGRRRDVERFGGIAHRDRHLPVAGVEDLGREALALRSEAESRRALQPPE